MRHSSPSPPMSKSAHYSHWYILVYFFARLGFSLGKKYFRNLDQTKREDGTLMAHVCNSFFSKVFYLILVSPTFLNCFWPKTQNFEPLRKVNFGDSFDYEMEVSVGSICKLPVQCDVHYCPRTICPLGKKRNQPRQKERPWPIVSPKMAPTQKRPNKRKRITIVYKSEITTDTRHELLHSPQSWMHKSCIANLAKVCFLCYVM